MRNMAVAKDTAKALFPYPLTTRGFTLPAASGLTSKQTTQVRSRVPQRFAEVNYGDSALNSHFQRDRDGGSHVQSE